jgi:hypothetical protein
MPPDIKKTIYKKWLTNEDFLLIELFTKRGKIIQFLLQYDALIEGKYRTILRTDNCHGSSPHKHVFHRQKGTFKQKLNLEPHEAFHQGFKLIKENFLQIKENFIFAS